MLLVDIAEEHIGVVADRIISNLLRPLEFDGRLLDVKASLGVAAANSGSGVGADELVRRPAPVEGVRLPREDPARLGRRGDLPLDARLGCVADEVEELCVERRGRDAPASGDLDRREPVESHLRDRDGREAERHLRVVRHRSAVEDVEEDVLREVRLGEDALPTASQ